MEMITVWYLGIILNGLPLMSVQPFNSEAGCILAAKLVEQEKFECVPMQIPAESDSQP